MQNGGNQIALSWNTAAGANHYMVERETGGSGWTVAAAVVTTASCGYGASLRDQLQLSGCGRRGERRNGGQLGRDRPDDAEPDLLSASVPLLSLTHGIAYAGPVASFTDANTVTGRPGLW